MDPNSIKIDLLTFLTNRIYLYKLENASLTVYCFIMLLLCCDATHDFSSGKRDGSREFEGESAEILASWVKQKWNNDIFKKTLLYCIKKTDEQKYSNIKYEDVKTILEEDFFQSDSKAQEKMKVILKYFGIEQATTTVQGCGEDYSILNILKEITRYNIDIKNPDSSLSTQELRATIDQTSDKTNLIPFYSELIKSDFSKRKNEAARPFGPVCFDTQIRSLYSLATRYDPSNDDSLQSSINKLGLSHVDDRRELKFTIKCGPFMVFEGKIIKDVNNKIFFEMTNYFGAIPKSGKIVLNNSKNAYGEKGNSVNGIITSIQQEKQTTNSLNTIFCLMGCKTMGDFLQIMYFLNDTKSNKYSFFLTFDKACAKIAALFHVNVFLETTFRDPEKKLTEGLSYFTGGMQRREAIKKPEEGLIKARKDKNPDFRGARDLLDFYENPKLINLAAASYSWFGKKNKLNSMSNKSIMTKLKSVGIKITRKRGKRRVYLSRSELIKRATTFRNLQLRAKKLKVRIMYKNRKGKYTYKTAKRLMNDIKRKMKMKMKKNPKTKPKKKVRNTRFGG